MLVLYNFEKAFNEIKGLPVVGHLQEYREFLVYIKPFLGPNIHIDSGRNPVLWKIIYDDIYDTYKNWYYYQSDYHLTKLELKGSEYDEEFDFTELFDDLVGAI